MGGSMPGNLTAPSSPGGTQPPAAGSQAGGPFQLAGSSNVNSMGAAGQDTSFGAQAPATPSTLPSWVGGNWPNSQITPGRRPGGMAGWGGLGGFSSGYTPGGQGGYGGSRPWSNPQGGFQAGHTPYDREAGKTNWGFDDARPEYWRDQIYHPYGMPGSPIPTTTPITGPNANVPMVWDPNSGWIRQDAVPGHTDKLPGMTFGQAYPQAYQNAYNTAQGQPLFPNPNYGVPTAQQGQGGMGGMGGMGGGGGLPGGGWSVNNQTGLGSNYMPGLSGNQYTGYGGYVDFTGRSWSPSGGYTNSGFGPATYDSTNTTTGADMAGGGGSGVPWAQGLNSLGFPNPFGASGAATMSATSAPTPGAAYVSQKTGGGGAVGALADPNAFAAPAYAGGAQTVNPALTGSGPGGAYGTRPADYDRLQQMFGGNYWNMNGAGRNPQSANDLTRWQSFAQGNDMSDFTRWLGYNNGQSGGVERVDQFLGAQAGGAERAALAEAQRQEMLRSGR